MSRPKPGASKQPDPQGGSGGPCAIREGRADTKLVERALREQWPIPDSLRPALIARLGSIVRSKKSSPREATSAAKALLMASRVNLESTVVAARMDVHEELRLEIEDLQAQLASLTEHKP